MSNKSSHTDLLYWRVAPKGVDTCLNCTEDICWHDRNDVEGENCPIWLAAPDAKVRLDSRAREALNIIKDVCVAGPISTAELASILMNKGYYRNMVYYLIDNDRLDTKRVKAHKSSRHKIKIMVKGIK